MILSDCENEHDRAGGEETEAGGEEVICRGPPSGPNSRSEAKAPWKKVLHNAPDRFTYVFLSLTN